MNTTSTAAQEYARNRAAKLREGTWEPLVDAEPARQHLRALMAARVPLKTVTEATGLDPSTLESLLYGRPTNSKRRKVRPGRFLTKRVRPETAAKILAIEVPPGEARFRAALEEIMRVTDPGDVRTELARAAWEQCTPARRIAREALGLPLIPEAALTMPTATATVEACPECRTGKHANCAGWALDQADEQVACPCAGQDHA